MLHLHNRQLVAQIVAVFWFLAILAESASAGTTAMEQLAAFSDKQFHELENKARHGDATAAVVLGIAYEEGIHVQKDETEAVRWFERAAAAGNAEVAHHLGILYETGRLVPQNYTEAAEWYRKAAALGFAPSQCNLGNFYRKGLGVPRDFDQAAKWYEVAARGGDAQSQSNLGYMYNRGEGVVHDDSRPCIGIAKQRSRAMPWPREISG